MLSIAGGAAGLLLAVWIDETLVGFLPSRPNSLAISATPDWADSRIQHWGSRC